MQKGGPDSASNPPLHFAIWYIRLYSSQSCSPAELCCASNRKAKLVIYIIWQSDKGEILSCNLTYSDIPRQKILQIDLYAEFLYEISNYYRSEDESAKYAKFLAVNKKIEAENKALVSKLNDIYQSYLNNKIEKRFLNDKLELRQRIVLIIVSVSFLCIIIVVITHGFGRRRVAKHKAAWEKTAGTLSEIMMKIEVKKFTDEPICKMILSIVNEQQFKSKIDYYYYRDFALGKEHLMELREAVNLHYENFTIRLRDKYPEFTDYDIDYCCLYLLGLKDADVAALMQKEYSNVCRRNRKIRKIIKSNNGLTETLYNLTNLQ